MAGTPYRNLKMFGKLCGGEEEIGRKVVFVSTMWDRLPEDKAASREKDLKQYWDPLIRLGAKVARSDGKPGSAQKIISDLLRAQKGPAATPVLIQDEVVNLNRPVIETEAAQTLYSDIQKLLQQHKQTLADLQEATKNTGDATQAQKLQQERERIEQQLEKSFEEAKRLKLSWITRFLKMFQKKAKGVSLQSVVLSSED